MMIIRFDEIDNSYKLLIGEQLIFKFHYVDIKSINNHEYVLTTVFNDGTSIAAFNKDNCIEIVVFAGNDQNKEISLFFDQILNNKQLSESQYALFNDDKEIFIQAIDGSIDIFDNVILLNLNSQNEMRLIFSELSNNVDANNESKTQSIENTSDLNDALFKIFDSPDITITGLYQLVGVASMTWSSSNTGTVHVRYGSIYATTAVWLSSIDNFASEPVHYTEFSPSSSGFVTFSDVSVGTYYLFATLWDSLGYDRTNPVVVLAGQTTEAYISVGD